MTDPAAAFAAFAVRMVATVEDALADGPRFAALLAEVGWRVDVPPAVLPAVRDALGVGPPLFDALAAVRRFLRLPKPGPVDVAALGTAAAPVLAALRGLGTVAGRFTIAPFDQAAFWAEVGRDLPALLFARRLAVDMPMLHAVLLVTGVVDRADTAPVGDDRLPYRRYVVDWSALGALIRDPTGHLAARYGWGGELDHDRLLRTMEAALVAMGVPARREATNPQRWDGVVPAGLRQLDIPIVEGPGEIEYVELGLTLVPVPGAGIPIRPEGLALVPRFGGRAAMELPLGPAMQLEIAAGADLDGGAEVVLLPSGAQLVVTGVDGSFEALVRFAHRPAMPRVLVGEPGSHRVELGEAWVSARVTGTVTGGRGDAEFVGELGVADDGLALVLDFSRSDGFLGKVFGASPERLALGGTLAWSSRTGLRLAGSAGLEVTLPVRRTIGVVRIDAVTVGISAGDEGVSATAAVSGALELGPMVVTVDRVGARLRFRPNDADDAGPADVAVTFDAKPPSGLGLALDTRVVKGGGFVLFDPEREQYAGLLHLEFVGTIAVTAIALLTTRMPDGSRGFSLFVLVAASGFPPIQLGFGFTLAGIGGMIGINRTVAVDALRNGLRTRALDAVLFPKDPAKNAPAIIQTLSTVFPAAQGQVVLGPMAILGWGPRNLLALRMGLILEVPSPTRLILIAQLTANLPDPALPVVTLNVDALGVLDLDRGELSLDATLHDSRIAGFALSGDMALRIGWGAEPRFLLSVGGWNPRYPVTEAMPALRRLTLELSGSKNPKLRFEAYFAITSNSVQFGARAELVVSAFGFTLEGRLGLDALIRFDPFGIVVDIAAALVVRRDDVVLLMIAAELTVSGPGPWRATGSASFKILMFSVSVGFDVTFGEALEALGPPPVNVAELLSRDVADRRNWSGELPAGAGALVGLGEPASDDTVVAVHPRGRLVFRQHTVPLNRSISTFGPSPVQGARSFSVEVDGGWLTDPTPVTGLFAPAEFDKLTDDQKLAAPAFVPMTAGISFTVEKVRIPATSRTRPVRPRRRIVDATRAGPERREGGRADATAATDTVRRSMGSGVRA